LGTRRLQPQCSDILLGMVVREKAKTAGKLSAQAVGRLPE
jgi:hypothetical protein